jgi:hypothetical protein
MIKKIRIITFSPINYNVFLLYSHELSTVTLDSMNYHFVPQIFPSVSQKPLLSVKDINSNSQCDNVL